MKAASGISLYIMCAISNAPKHKCSYNWHGKRSKHTAEIFISLPSSLLASTEVTESQIAEAYATVDLTNIKYNTYIHSREEKMEVILLTGPKNWIDGKIYCCHCKKIKFRFQKCFKFFYRVRRICCVLSKCILKILANVEHNKKNIK